MSYRCTKGCKSRDRRGDWHDRKSDCPFEPTYLHPGTPVIAVTPESPVEGGQPAAHVGVLPAPPAPRRIGITRLALSAEGGPPAQVQSRFAKVPDTVTVQVDWILDPVYSRRCWNLFFGGWLWGLDAVGKFYDYHPVQNRSAFQLTQFENTSLNNDPTSFMCRIPTFILKQIGMKTLEEAQSLIDDVEFLTFLGKPLYESWDYLNGLYHDSPKLKKAREEAERKAHAIDAKYPDVTPPSMATPPLVPGP